MDALTRVYSALQNELKGLSEDHKKLKSTLSANVSNDIESLKTAALNALEQKKFQLLADITTSEKLNRDAGKIQTCADRLSADFAKLSSNPTPSQESIKAFERQVLEVKSVVEAIHGEQAKGLSCEKVLGEIKASIMSLSLGDNKVSKDARPTPTSENDNSMWLLTSSRKVSEKEVTYSFSNPAGEGDDMNFWLRPATTIKVEKEWCNATAQWFKFASTMEWLTPRGPSPSTSATILPAPKPAESRGADSIVTSWKNFANGVEWCKPRDAGGKKDEPSAKKAPEASAPASSTKNAGDVLSGWAATASGLSWLATPSQQKTAAPPTSAPNDCIWLAQKPRETSAPASKDVFSSWSKAAADVSWVTKKAGTSPPVSTQNPLARWQPDPGLTWVIENKRQAPPTSSKETTPSQAAVKELSNMDMWLPKGQVPIQRKEDTMFSFPTHSSDDDSKWLMSTASKTHPPPLSIHTADNMSEWLLPSPTSGLHDDDSQDFEIVEDSLIS